MFVEPRGRLLASLHSNVACWLVDCRPLSQSELMFNGATPCTCRPVGHSPELPHCINRVPRSPLLGARPPRFLPLTPCLSFFLRRNLDRERPCDEQLHGFACLSACLLGRRYGYGSILRWQGRHFVTFPSASTNFEIQDPDERGILVVRAGISRKGVLTHLAIFFPRCGSGFSG